MNVNNSNDKTKIKIKGEFNLCDEFPTKKKNFENLCKLLTSKGYIVESEIKETMESAEKDEVSVVLDNDKEIKVFTSCDPYASQAIIDSTMHLRLNDIVNNVDKIVKENKQ
jgi:hypothetical protein